MLLIMGEDLPHLSTLAERLRWARLAAKLTQNDVAERIGVTAAAVSGWERGVDEPTRPNLRKAAATYGVPLAWLVQDQDSEGFGEQSQEYDHDRGFTTLQPYRGEVDGAFPGVDARGGTGPGQIGETRLIKLDHGGTAIGHRVVEEWLFPPDYVRHELHATPSRLIMLEIIGDSMSPTLVAGDRVVVDYGHTKPTPDGLYVIDEGDGPMVKRLQLIRRSDPPQIQILSDNPNHLPYTMDLESIAIVGRVAARISRT